MKRTDSAWTPADRTQDPRAWYAAGVIVASLLAIEWCWIYFSDPRSAAALFSAVFTQVLVGREGGIPVGLVGGASPWLVLQFSVIEDLVETLIAVGLVWWAAARYHGADASPSNWFAKTSRAVERRTLVFTRWRAVGVFAFTLVPFMVNGPLVAALGARMIGLGRMATFAAIATGSLVAGASWTLIMIGIAPLVTGWWIALAVAILAAVLVVRLGVARWTGRSDPVPAAEAYRTV